MERSTDMRHQLGALHERLNGLSEATRRDRILFDKEVAELKNELRYIRQKLEFLSGRANRWAGGLLVILSACGAVGWLIALLPRLVDVFS